VYNATRGRFDDGSSTAPYNSDEPCTFIIRPLVRVNVISIQVTYLALEPNYDFLTITQQNGRSLGEDGVFVDADRSLTATFFDGRRLFGILGWVCRGGRWIQCLAVSYE
jgi:hypothetical protein